MPASNVITIVSTPASDVITLVSAVAAAVSALAAAAGLFYLGIQIRLGEKATEATVFLRIYDGWSSIYPEYRALLDSPFDLKEVTRAYTGAAFMASDRWRKMRSVFAFYEFLGACIEANLLKERTLFSLVTVNTDLWDKYEPLISWLRRETGRDDLYVSWQALDRRKRRLAGKPPA